MCPLSLSCFRVVIEAVLRACSNSRTGTICLRRCSLVRDIVGRSHRATTEESVRARLTLPTNYSRREFNWMPQGRFDSILNGARAAVRWLKQGVDWEDAKLKCAPDQVVAVCAEEVNSAASDLDQAVHFTLVSVVGTFNRAYAVHAGTYVPEIGNKSANVGDRFDLVRILRSMPDENWHRFRGTFRKLAVFARNAHLSEGRAVGTGSIRRLLGP